MEVILRRPMNGVLLLFPRTLLAPIPLQYAEDGVFAAGLGYTDGWTGDKRRSAPSVYYDPRHERWAYFNGVERLWLALGMDAFVDGVDGSHGLRYLYRDGTQGVLYPGIDAPPEE